MTGFFSSSYGALMSHANLEYVQRIGGCNSQKPSRVAATCTAKRQRQASGDHGISYDTGVRFTSLLEIGPTPETFGKKGFEYNGDV